MPKLENTMLNFKIKKDGENQCIETNLCGKPLLTTPQLNKGTAFTEEERHAFKIIGKIPARIETLDDQVKRCYLQYKTYKNNLNRNIYLNELHDTNQVLFYKLVSEHLQEMLPAIYTPIVGTAVKKFSEEYRRPRGLYVSYQEREHILEILNNRSNPEIDLIVVTDGEGVLGIGDQGIGGMDIPIAKLMVYTLCGGINPCRTLPILLDVGTNNEELLNDPLYLGWRHPRLAGKEYDDFIGEFVDAVHKTFPDIFLHWEDFGRDNARKNLERYQNSLCTFNDDMQGTGVVTLAAILAGVHAKNEQLKDQRVVVFGGGTAGTGIADQIADAMVREGLSQEDAYKNFWMLDRPGLLTSDIKDLTDFQKTYARDPKEITSWQLQQANTINLLDVINNVKPTILIGCSAVTNAFNEQIIKNMAEYVERPIILPLSNPTERAEATPVDIFTWTQGRAMVATGSPFDDINYNGVNVRIAQCNNAFVFPGIGLGLIAVKAKHLSGATLWAACNALSDHSPVIKNPTAPLLPAIDEAQEIALKIATAVAKQVIKEKNNTINIKGDLESHIKSIMWEPYYLPMRFRSP